ncbi:MAG: hypothetical protein WDA71_14055 [Actinomycetota bacterium]
MGGAEEDARREAVMRVLTGEPPGKVACDLGRSDRWVRKWVGRYEPADEAWASERSRAPALQVRKTPAEIERLVLEIRERAMANPWAQVGAVAIAWEMDKLGVGPPEVWTIDRILARAGVAKRRAQSRYVPKGTPYPQGSTLVRPGAVHEIDLVGARHLDGAIPFYALNAVDLGRRRAAIEILATNQEWDVAGGLIRIWQRLGVPRQVQFDNGHTIQGRGRQLAVAVWTCLALGVRVRFIPFAEPWRNAVIEHFNDVFDKRFFRTERFSDLAHLERRACAFEAFHNSHHRYSVLGGATAQEWERKLGFTPKLLDPSFTPPQDLPRRGQIEFVRLIRSDRVLKVLGSKIEVPGELVHRYVIATLHVRAQRLALRCEDHPWRAELPFSLKF